MTKEQTIDRPTVYCPKEQRRVPLWYCLGSFMQRLKSCPYLIEMKVNHGKTAEVKCNFK